MTTRKRVEDEGSTRAVLMKSAERIMLEDGYAAVTYRNVAAKAGVSLGAVQYHFPSLDDLFMAVVDEYAQRTIDSMVAELRANPDEVLRVLWESSNDEVSTALLMEFMAVVNHRKGIQLQIASFAEQYRKVQLDALTEHWEKLGLSNGDLTPAGVAFLLTCLPRWMRLEDSFKLGEDGHADVRRLVARYLEPSRSARDIADPRKPTSAGGSESDEPPVLGAALRTLGKRATLSAKAAVHYTRIARDAWTQRDGGDTTDRH